MKKLSKSDIGTTYLVNFLFLFWAILSVVTNKTVWWVCFEITICSMYIIWYTVYLIFSKQ